MWPAQQNSTQADRAPMQQLSSKSLLEFASIQRLRTYRPRQIVLNQGDLTAYIIIVVDGWAEQTISLSDGRRQIAAFGMPGDLCCSDLAARTKVELSISALTPLTVAIVGKLEFRALLTANARLARAFWRSQMLALAIQRRWTAVVGLMGARERVAHLLCELYLRQEKIGATSKGSCAFPLTQTQVAEACGLTQVHTNRVIQDLRRSGLIELSSRRLAIPCITDLMSATQFDGSYLDLGELDPTRTELPVVQPPQYA